MAECCKASRAFFLLPIQAFASAIDAADFAGFNAGRLAAIEARDIAVMSTAQLGQLKTTLSIGSDMAAFSSAQLNAMSTAQFAAATPLVLDLGGDGIKSTPLSDGVQFDLLATGNRIPTGWVGEKDGLLVRDINQNGLIDSGAELFGRTFSSHADRCNFELHWFLVARR
jgi:hypothetical protein